MKNELRKGEWPRKRGSFGACVYYWHVLKVPRKGVQLLFLVLLFIVFCFYLASFAFSFSRIVHYAPSRSKQKLLS